MLFGIDPGLATMGLVCVDYNRTIIDARFIETKPSDRKSKRAVDDNLERVQYVYRTLQTLFARYKPRVVCAEAFSPPRNASAASKVAMAWGVLGALAVQHDCVIVNPTPQEVKIAVTGRRDASKQDIQDALTDKYPLADRLHIAGLAKGKWEHMFDALAVLECSFSDPVVRVLCKQ